MGDDRYEQLIEKRGTSGLNDEEADELGRLIAERNGQPYGGAEARSEEQAQEDLADEEGRRERGPSSFDTQEREGTEELGER
jgi:hypothetical protein